MPNNLLTAGEFARLASTTKRTILFYAEKGILPPKKIDSWTKYRYYEPRQIVDFQVILLLQKMGFSLENIKKLLRKKSLRDAFLSQKKSVEREINQLQTTLKDIGIYYSNIAKTATLVNPVVKKIKPFNIYYIDKLGPYSQIGSYFEEFYKYFTKLPKNTVSLTIYEDYGYRPQKAKIKIGYIIKPGIKIKKGVINPVKKMAVPGFKTLSYTHNGSSKLLSLLWQELAKYRKSENLKPNLSLPFEDMEFYYEDSSTELIMPIK